MSYAYTEKEGGKGRRVFGGMGGDWGIIEGALAKEGRQPGPEAYGINRRYHLDPNTYAGMGPPKLSKQDKEEGKLWVRTGTHGFQTNSPSSGSTNHQVPVWSKIQTGDRPSDAKPDPAPAAPESPRQPFTPSPDLIAAQAEAKDRAQQWLGSGSSAAGAASGSGVGTGNIYADVYAMGAGQVDDYKRRFLPSLTADAMLQAKETGEASRYWLGQLSPDVKPPDVLSWKQIKDQTKWSGRFATST